MTADQLQETIDLLHAIKEQWPGIDLQCVRVCMKPVDPTEGPFMVPILARYPSGMFRYQDWTCEDTWTEAEMEQIDLVLFMNRHGDRVRVGYGVKSNLLVIELTTEHVSEYRERGRAMSRQTRIAALRRLAAPNSGATDNERAVALDKIALLEGKQGPTRRVDPTFDPYRKIRKTGWYVSYRPMPDMDGALRRAWDQVGEEMARRMREIVYDAFKGGGSVNDMADEIRRGMDNVHGG